MYISPSKILYTNCIELGSFPEFPTHDSIMEVTRTIQKGGTYPRLQVVKKDGYYFTLNDTQLRLYRYLEKVGQCGSVQVDRVPIREVPQGIRNLMRAPDTLPKGKCTPRKQKGKYHSVQSIEGKPNEVLIENSTEDEDEPSSDEGDTDDESDWSDEDGLSDTDVDTSEDEQDEDTEERIENACESESFI